MLNTRLFDDDESPPLSFDVGLGSSSGNPSWKAMLFRVALSALGLGQGSLHPVAPLHQTMGVCAFFQLAAIGFCGVSWGVYCMYLLASRLVHKYRRPSYYNAEAERRAAKLLAQRSAQHRIRKRSSILLPPSKEELLEAWAKASKRGATEEKLQLGAMLVTIEAVVDNGLIRDDTGTIIGRKGGVKAWILQNCPKLYNHYSALMHYKALADKVQRVCGLEDPDPVGVVLHEEDGVTITVGPKIPFGSNDSCSPCVSATSPLLWTSFDMDIGERHIRLTGVKITVGPEWVQAFQKRAVAARMAMECLWKEASGSPFDTANGTASISSLEPLLYQRLGMIREHRLQTVETP